MRSISLDPAMPVSDIKQMYDHLNSDPELPETIIDWIDGMPVLVLPELEATAEEEMEILEEAL